MSSTGWNPLLHVPTYPVERYGQLADRIGRLLETTNPVLLVQAEAVVALEAVATSLARPGLTAINVVTSPYGTWFGTWLERSGAKVVNIAAQGGKPIDVESVAGALDHHPDAAILSLVHAESASGILNPLPEILSLAKQHDIVTVVDAVASIGGHPLSVDALGIDIAVIGPQKALAGPAGLSALSISPAARELVDGKGNRGQSVLSLSDLCAWHDQGRGALPGTPPALEFFALEAALDRVEAEGLGAIVERHRQAGTAARQGLLALGIANFVVDAQASNLVTAAPLPDGVHALEVMGVAKRLGAGLTGGVGEIAAKIVRLNHTGGRACFESVLAGVVGYGAALNVLGFNANIGAAAEAVAHVFSD